MFERSILQQKDAIEDSNKQSLVTNGVFHYS
jgi:hypothetical protein